MHDSTAVDAKTQKSKTSKQDECDGSLCAEVGNGPWYWASCVGSVLGPSFRGEKWDVIASVTSSALRNIPAHATVSPGYCRAIGIDKIDTIDDSEILGLDCLANVGQTGER